MMKKTLLILLLLLASIVPLNAQTTLTATPITDPDQLVDGATYLVSAFSSTKKEYYCDFHIQQIKEGENYYWLKKDHVFQQPAQAAAESDLLMLKKSGNQWFLYSPQVNGYIGPDVITYQSNALISNEQTSDNAITFEKTTEGLQMKFGNGSYLWYNNVVKEYQFAKKANEDRLNILLYLIGESSTTLLDDTGISAPIDMQTDVEWACNWHKGYYNTLCVPFDIENYHAVFGSSTIVYQLKSAQNNNICFERVDDYAVLKAHTPYLLKGELDGNDTLQLYNVHLQADSLRSPVFGNDTVFIQGIFQPIQLSQKSNAFVLFKDQFVCCKNQKNLRLPPFHWYVVLKDSAKAPLKLGIRNSSEPKKR